MVLFLFNPFQECYFCQRKKDRNWHYKRICNDCYNKLFIEPNFENIFGTPEKPKMKYGDHYLFLGTTGVGKTNVFLWFFKHTNLRCVWFHSVAKVDVKKQAEIVLNERDIYSHKLSDVLKDVRYKKILVVPSERMSKKQISQLFEMVCDICFEHTDPIYRDLWRDRGFEIDKDIDRAVNVVIMNDELMDVTWGSSDKDMTNGHYRALHKGRNHALSLFVACQRNQDIPKMHCNLATVTLIFKLKRYDITALRDRVDDVHYAEMLPEYHFIYSSTLEGTYFYKKIPLMLWK